MQDEEAPLTMTAIETIALYCPAESNVLAELRGMIARDADVRTLDEADPNWCMNLAPSGHYCRLPTVYETRNLQWFYGATPDEARAKAAAWLREQGR